MQWQSVLEYIMCISPCLHFALLPCSMWSSLHHRCTAVWTLLPTGSKNHFFLALQHVLFWFRYYPDQPGATDLSRYTLLTKLHFCLYSVGCIVELGWLCSWQNTLKMRWFVRRRLHRCSCRGPFYILGKINEWFMIRLCLHGSFPCFQQAGRMSPSESNEFFYTLYSEGGIYVSGNQSAKSSKTIHNLLKMFFTQVGEINVSQFH